MDTHKKFFILYQSDKVISDNVECDVIIDGKIVSNITDVQDYINKNQFLHVNNKKNKDVLLNTYNILKIKYYENGLK
jgi:hypothetical protein